MLLVAVCAAIGIGIGAVSAAGHDRAGNVTGGSALPSNATPQQIVRAEVHSLSSSPYSQDTFRFNDATFAGKQERLLANLSVVVDADSTHSRMVAGRSVTVPAADVSINYGSTLLGEIRVVGVRHIYVLANVTAWEKLPLNLSSSAKQQLQGVGALVSGRWFELPASIFRGMQLAPARNGLSPGEIRRWEQMLAQAVSFTRLADQSGENVVQVSGTNLAVVRAIGRLVATTPGLRPIAGKLTMPPTSSLNGSFSARLFGSPDGVLQRATFGDTALKGFAMGVTIAHASVPVNVPSGATPLPPQILQGLNGLNLPSGLT